MALGAAAFNMSVQYQGRVFEDVNGNGIYDKGDKPLAQVAVNDGLNVVKTGKDGRFSISGSGNPFVTITVPTGYMANRGHYIPAGSTQNYDFPLKRYTPKIGKDGRHSFIQVTDSEIFNTTGNDKWISDVKQLATDQGAAFVVHTGDICYITGLKEHITLMNSDLMEIPVYYCVGNHDLVAGKYGEELFESIYGPVYYSFDVAGTHYVVTPMPGGDHRPSYTTDQIARWLRNDLQAVKPGTPVIMLTHDLLTNGNEFLYGTTEKLNLNDANLKAWIYGHWHINHMKQQGDVVTICTSTPDKGGIDHSTGSYRLIHTDMRGNIESTLVYPYLHDHAVIASPQGESSTGTVTVNAYSSTSPVKSVIISCESEGKTVIKNLKLKQQTDWSWTARLPEAALAEGKDMKLTARVIYNSGKETTAESMYRHTAPKAYESGSDWTNLVKNAAHNGGVVTDAHIDSTASLAWVMNVGSNLYMTSPLVYDGMVYTASVDENMKGGAAVYALDAATGELKWKTPVKNSIKNTIAITDGKVFAQDTEGQIYALNAKDGSIAWEHKLPARGLPAMIEGLAATDGKVFAGTGKALSAFDANSGKLLWRNDEWNQGEGTTSTLAVGAGTVIGSVQWSALYGNDEKTGKKLWSESKEGLSNRGSTPAIHGNLAYLVSMESFFIIDATSGRIIARKKLPMKVDATSTPLLTDSEIVFGTSENGIAAIDNETFEVKWICPTGKSLIYTSPYTRPDACTSETSPIMCGDVIYTGASDGKLYGIDRKSGKTVWQHDCGAPVFSSVAISGNSMYATDFGGNVYCFR